MEMVLRATAVYWFLWLVIRGTGKRSLAELTPLDLLLLIVIGDFVQQGVTQEDMSVTGALLAVSVFVVWTLLGDAILRKWRPSAGILVGEPVIVLRQGVPIEEKVKKERVSLDDLKEAARMEGFGDLAHIEYAILETDGRFSFIGRG
ncbi:MAG TPA: YetF domain-containing protein [Acidimicrobiia bacterium]|nr:YetF domain-containing protein [Acidimicrobiia bacterium]